MVVVPLTPQDRHQGVIAPVHIQHQEGDRVSLEHHVLDRAAELKNLNPLTQSDEVGVIAQVNIQHQEDDRVSLDQVRCPPVVVTHNCKVPTIQQVLDTADELIKNNPLTQCINVWKNELTLLVEHAHNNPTEWNKTPEELQLETEWLLKGLAQGFVVIQTDHAPPGYRLDNYPVPDEHMAAIRKDTNEDADAQCVIEVSDEPKWLTPLFVREETDKIRVLRDYSIKKGPLRTQEWFQSVNDTAWHDSFQMMSVDDAFVHMRPGCSMAKIDIKKAFRVVPISPSNYEHMAFKVGNKYYLETRLAFGLKNAPEIFQRITRAVYLMMRRRGIHAVVVYIDDFWISAATAAECQLAYDCLLQLLTSLGFMVSIKKCEPPTQSIRFLGVQLDSDADRDGSNRMQASVPIEKLTALKQLCGECITKQLLTIKKAQSLLGKLASVAKVVFAGRPFVRRIINSITTAEREGRLVQVDAQLKGDLIFWLRYASECNGQTHILQTPHIHPAFFSTDACLKGIGGFLHGKFFHAQLTRLARHSKREHRQHRNLWPGGTGIPTHIGYIELFAVWWALVLWQRELQGYTMQVFIDNSSVMHALRTGTHKNPAYMRLIRKIYWLMASSGFRLLPVPITSKANVLSDILSREGPTEEFHAAVVSWKTRFEATEQYYAPLRDTRLQLALVTHQ